MRLANQTFLGTLLGLRARSRAKAQQHTLFK